MSLIILTITIIIMIETTIKKIIFRIVIIILAYPQEVIISYYEGKYKIRLAN